MDTDLTDNGLAARLKRLDAGSAQAAPGFDYDGLVDRHAVRSARARRRLALARGAAAGMILALLFASLWRLGEPGAAPPPVLAVSDATRPASDSLPRIVRADTYLALAALEDHIASVDDAINMARVYSPQGTELARLERTRAELLDSYAQVRYAELVSANF
jgi:hypothetical protein